MSTDHLPSEKATAAPTPALSQTNTITDSDTNLMQRTASAKDREAVAGLDHAGTHAPHPLSLLGPARKNFLLFIFSIAGFVDICNVSGVAVAVSQIGVDIGLGGISQFVWIITAYSLTFAAFLLFAGRLSDLFPASVVFTAGFALLGIISLVTSFVTNSQFGFLILRGIGGICGSLTIPSGYHLTVHLFPDPKEQQGKLAILGVAGAVGNAVGLVLAGLCMTGHGSYHWFFRLIAIICLVFSGLTIVLLPYTGSSHKPDGTPRWKRLDLVGVILMMGALICFILGLTQGPIDGWNSASFIAPFVLSFPLAIGFFVWEAKIPAKSAILPSSVWKSTNIIISSLAILIAFPFWATSQLQYANYFQIALGWSPLRVAAAMLPQGIVALIVGIVVGGGFVPQVITKPRISLPIGAVLIIIAQLLQIFSDGGRGMDYWRYCFPAFVLGSAGATMCFFASAINLITYCPPEMGGVAGGWTQTVAQVGGAITLAVQASFEGHDLTGFLNWRQSGARSFWFMIGWTAIFALQYVVFYKTPGTPEEEHEKARKRLEEAGQEIGV